MTTDTTTTAPQLDTAIIAFAVAEALHLPHPDDMPPGKQGDYLRAYYDMRNALLVIRDLLERDGVKVAY